MKNLAPMPFLLLTTALLTLASCTTTVDYAPRYPVVAENTSTKLLGNFIELYPREFKAVHRIVFAIRSREFDFTGYFLMRRPETYHAAAYAEAGAPVFEFQNLPTKSMVFKKPDIFSEQEIIEGVMQDLLHLYRKQDKQIAVLVDKTPNERTFTFGTPETVINEFTIDLQKGLVRSLTAMEGKVIRTVEYSEPKAFPKWRTKIPTRIKVKNLAFGYELAIDVVEFHPELPSTFDQMMLQP